MSDSGLKKNLSYNTVGMVLYNFAIWALSAIIMRKLGAEASGMYAVAMSLGNTLYASALWGMRSFIVSDVHSKYTEQEYLSARTAAVILSVLVLVPVIGLSHYSSVQSSILVAYTLFKCSEALIELTECFNQKNFHMEINAQGMIIRSVLYIIGFYGILSFSRSLTAAFAALTLLSFAVFLFFSMRKVRQITPFAAKIVLNRKVLDILKSCFPIMVFELLASLIIAVPRLFFEQIGSLSALGIYNSVYTFVIFLQLVINVLIYTLAPYMAKAYHEHRMQEFRKYLLIVSGGAVGLGAAAEIMSVLLGRFVIGLVYGPEAQPYYTYLYMGIVSGVSLAFTWIASQIFVILSKQNIQMYCSLISTAACFILSKLLVNASDCNRMSLVLSLTNLIYICAAAVFGLLMNRNSADA